MRNFCTSLLALLVQKYNCDTADEQVICRELAIFVRELGKNLKDKIYHEVPMQKGTFMTGSMGARQMVQAILVEHLVRSQFTCLTGRKVQILTLRAAGLALECPKKQKLSWLSLCADSIQQEVTKLFKAQLEELEAKIQKCDQVKLSLTSS